MLPPIEITLFLSFSRALTHCGLVPIDAMSECRTATAQLVILHLTISVCRSLSLDLKESQVGYDEGLTGWVISNMSRM